MAFRGELTERSTRMAWDERGYYYRSEREGKTVRRTYIGRGYAADVVSQLDAAERRNREAERAARRDEQTEQDALDAPLNELNDLADALARAALTAAGYHQHKRQWRKRRAQSNPGDEARPAG
jgi:hypothetical protein